MKTLVIGSTGFIGSEVVRVLSERHDVYGASYHANESERSLALDLNDKDNIRRVLEVVKPEAVIDCAGIISGPDTDLNITFTNNLMEAIVESRLPLKRVILTGSAAEYGRIKPDELPVTEDTPLRADAGYGLSKLKEEVAAFSFADSHNLPVVIVRPFNPVGPNMGPKFLISGILRQFDAIRSGEAKDIEVSRLDSERDYVDVEDVARAYEAVLSGEPAHRVYNIGSGESTSNGQLIDYILDVSDLPTRPDVRETATEKEPHVASKADITRLRSDFGWQPQIGVKDMIERIVHDR